MPRHDNPSASLTVVADAAEETRTRGAEFTSIRNSIESDRDHSTASATGAATTAPAATSAITSAAAAVSSTAAATSAASSSSSSSNMGMIVGLAVGIPVLIAVVCGAAWLFMRRRKRNAGPIGVGVFPRKGSGANISKPSLPMSRSSSSSSVWGAAGPGAAASVAAARSNSPARHDLSDTEMQPLNGEAGVAGAYYQRTAYGPRGQDADDDRHIADSFEPNRAPNQSVSSYSDYYDDGGPVGGSADYSASNRVPDVADLAASNITRMHSYQRSSSAQRAAAANNINPASPPSKIGRQNSYAVSAMSAPQSAGDAAARDNSRSSPVSPAEDNDGPPQLGLPSNLVDQLRGLPNQRFPSLGDGGETFQAMLTDQRYGDSRRGTDDTNRAGSSFEELPLHMPAEEQAHAPQPPQGSSTENGVQQDSVYELNRAPNTNKF